MRLRYYLFFFFTLSSSLAFSETPESALERLKEGNERYQECKLLHPNRCQESRNASLQGQKPFAAILGCSDSRVSPEIVFDQGIGDLFVVRVAGNVAGGIELDSLDYAADVLGCSIILVLGHQNCGAVEAVIQGKQALIEDVAALIEPSYQAVKNKAGNRNENLVKANVRAMVERIKESDNIRQLMKDGKITVIGGYYHLESGEVEFLK